MSELKVTEIKLRITELERTITDVIDRLDEKPTDQPAIDTLRKQAGELVNCNRELRELLRLY